MITINYLKTIYIRFQYNESNIINDDSYIIDVTDDESMVIYNAGEFAIEIAKFKNMIDVVKYVKEHTC